MRPLIPWVCVVAPPVRTTGSCGMIHRATRMHAGGGSPECRCSLRPWRPGLRGLAEAVLLEAAQRGDGEAFARLLEPYRVELHAHCYRMLGSFHDAEDVFQETLLRAWRGLPRFGGQKLIRPWLFKIATNACLDALKQRPKRLLPKDYAPPLGPDDSLGQPVAEPIWIQNRIQTGNSDWQRAWRGRKPCISSARRGARLYRCAAASSGDPARRAHAA